MFRTRSVIFQGDLLPEDELSVSKYAEDIKN